MKPVLLYEVAISNRKRPTVSWPFSRQAMANQGRTASAAQVAKGAYVLEDCDWHTELILIGSRAPNWISASRRPPKQLSAKGRKVRVSLDPCVELFEEQDASYRESVAAGRRA